MDKGPSSIWEAPNAIMVSLKDQAAFDEGVAKLRQFAGDTNAVGFRQSSIQDWPRLPPPLGRRTP